MSLKSEIFTKKEITTPGRSFGVSILASIAFLIYICNAHVDQQFLKDVCIILVQIQAIIIPVFIAATIFILTQKSFIEWFSKGNGNSLQSKVSRMLNVTLRLTISNYFIFLFVFLIYYIYILGFKEIIYPYYGFQIGLSILCTLTFYCQLQTFNIISIIINIALVEAKHKDISEVFKE